MSYTVWIGSEKTIPVLQLLVSTVWYCWAVLFINRFTCTTIMQSLTLMTFIMPEKAEIMDRSHIYSVHTNMNMFSMQVRKKSHLVQKSAPQDSHCHHEAHCYIHWPAARVGGPWSILGTVSLQGDDHSLQMMQGQVDGLGFGQLLAIHPRLGHPLWASQVHQVELGSAHKERDS